MISRGHVIAAVAGLLAPFALVELLLLSSVHVWIPIVKYLWTAHEIANAKAPIDTAAILDAFIAALLGFGIALGVARMSRSRPVPLWLVFASFFVISLTVPTLFSRDYEALLWVLSRPFISIFLVFAALGFWLPSRPQVSRHVA
jgi:hypothetical protein